VPCSDNVNRALLLAQASAAADVRLVDEADLLHAFVLTGGGHCGARFEEHYCPLVAGWLKAGIPVSDIPKLCDIAMDGDRNIAKTAGVDFSLGKTIAAGDNICEVNFFKGK